MIYTKDEYKQMQRYDRNKPFNGIICGLVSDENYKKWLGRCEDYKSINLYKALYGKFDELPLLINCEDHSIQEIVKWRLKIGK